MRHRVLDAELAALPARLAPLIGRSARPVDSASADVWFEPSLVLEVLGAELTLSPNHTAGWGQLKDDAGLSMRFPRFTGRWRDDKEAPGRHHYSAARRALPHHAGRRPAERCQRDSVVIVCPLW